MYQEAPEQEAEREVREAEEEARQAAREEYAAELAEHLELERNRSLLDYLISRYELKYLTLENASLEVIEASKRLHDAKQRLLNIQQGNDAQFSRVIEMNDKVNDEVAGEKAGEEKAAFKEVEHMTLDNIGHEPMEDDMAIDQVVQEEESYYVEPEIVDFIFAPNSFDHNDEARLLDFLPKIFGVSNRSRSWRYTTPCFTHSKRASPSLYNPQPTLLQDYTHVRGWSINDLKWPWQFKVRLIFEWCFGFDHARRRSYSSLWVRK